MAAAAVAVAVAAAAGAAAPENPEPQARSENSDQLTRRSQRTVKYVRWRTSEPRDLSGVGF